MDTGDEEVSKMLNQLTGVRILTVDDSELAGRPDFYAELNSEGFFNNNEFEVLMEVTESDEVVRFLARYAGNGKFSDLILVVGGEESALISISGIIDPENIGKITKAVDIDLDGQNRF